MVELPDEVLSALRRYTEETVLDALKTAGQHPFGDLGTEDLRASLWCVVTDTRAWIVAAHEAHHAVWGAGHTGTVRLERGWVTDTLHVGRHALPLRTGTRRAGTALVETWQGATRGGASVRPASPPALPTGRGRAARAALGLPEWWTAAVPSASSARWLMAYETSSFASFDRWDGQPVAAPVWIGVSDEAVVAVAWDERESQLRFRPLGGVLERISSATRARLEAPGVQLVAPLLGQQLQRLLCAMSAATTEQRWSLLAEHHLDQSRPRDAMLAWEEAVSCGRQAACWPGIARMAWSVVDTRRAHRALCWALQQGQLTPADRSDWAAPTASRARLLAQPQAEGAAFADVLGHTIDQLAVAPRPPLFPEPAANEAELWMGALAAMGRWTDAQACARALDDDPRGREVVAALRSAEGHSAADQAWYEAAMAWHARGHLDAARRCLTCAMEHRARPLLSWVAGAWAIEAGRDAEARTRWLEALASDPEGRFLDDDALEPGGWRALAVVAEAQSAWVLAGRAWRRHLDGTTPVAATVLHLADLLAKHLGEKPEAAARLAELAISLDASDDPEVDPAHVWLEVAGLTEGDEALAALKNAVSRGSLDVDVLRRAVARAEVLGHDDLATWWRHLLRVVLGSSVPRQTMWRPPVLGPDEADGLHPGGSDWLARLRRSLDPPEPPAHHEVVRGLGPLSETSEPATSLLHEVCERLGLPHTDAYVYRGEGSWGVSAWPTRPPVLLVGFEHLKDGPRQADDGAMRFMLAVELAHLRCGHPLVELDDGLVGTSRSLYAAFGRFATPAENLVDLLLLLPGIDQAQKIQRVVRLSRRVFAARAAIDKATELAQPLLSWFQRDEEAALGVGREGFEGSALQLRIHADRVALRVTGDVEAALRAILLASSRSHQHVAEVVDRGLADVLRDDVPILATDEVLRIGSLLAFAAESGPFGGTSEDDVDAEEHA